MTPPGLLVAAVKSGSGKTTVALGLIAALRRRGLAVQPYKCGPDYIDPGFHAAAAGRPSYNLDSWAMTRASIDSAIAAAAAADVIVAEGSMGLFDGAPSAGAWGDGSNADIAALTGFPVVLVLDVAGHAQSAGAVALGATTFRRDVAVAGAILNRVASPRHEALARLGLERAGVACFGAIARNDGLTLPERHLGLVQAEEDPDLADRLDGLANQIGLGVDIDALLGAARPGRVGVGARLAPPGQTIALARDRAFSFVYPHLIEGWRSAGAEIRPFSPLADEAPDPEADLCWLPGGYPELHAGPLAAAVRFKAGMRRFAEHKPVHGECGGYMALGRGLVAADGTRHEMLGLLGLETSFARRKLHLGYRRAELLAPIPGAPAGAVLRGHEFHYASVLAQPDAALATVTAADGSAVAETGARRGRVTGTFFHMVDRA